MLRIFTCTLLLLMANSVAVGSPLETSALNSAADESFDPEPEVLKIASDIETTDQVEKRLAWYVEWSVYGILKRADWAFRIRGMNEEADAIWLEWNEYKAAIRQLSESRFAEDIGDHKPLSLWLARMYERLSGKFGPAITQAMHLNDLNIINFAIPVVFNPSNSEIDREEYARHFVPLSGTFTYWILLGICELTVQIPVVGSFCETGALVGQQIMLGRFSGMLSDFVWNRYNH